MSSSDRRTFLAGLTLGLPALAACGFTPVYAPGESGDVLRGAVRVDDPTSRADFDLIRAVEDRLGRPNAPRFALSVTQQVTSSGLAVQGSAAVTRYNVIGTVDYLLTRIADGTVLASGKTDSFTSYSATSSTVAAASAEADARRRLSVILADQIVTALLLDLPDGA